MFMEDLVQIKIYIKCRELWDKNKSSTRVGFQLYEQGSQMPVCSCAMKQAEGPDPRGAHCDIWATVSTHLQPPGVPYLNLLIPLPPQDSFCNPP